MKGTACQVGYLLELYRDARSPEYKIYLCISGSHNPFLNIKVFLYVLG